MDNPHTPNYSALTKLYVIDKNNKVEVALSYFCKVSFVVLTLAVVIAKDSNSLSPLLFWILSLVFWAAFGSFIFLAKRSHDRARLSNRVGRPKRGLFTSVVIYIFLPAALFTLVVVIGAFIAGTL